MCQCRKPYFNSQSKLPHPEHPSDELLYPDVSIDEKTNILSSPMVRHGVCRPAAQVVVREVLCYTKLTRIRALQPGAIAPPQK